MELVICDVRVDDFLVRGTKEGRSLPGLRPFFHSLLNLRDHPQRLADGAPNPHAVAPDHAVSEL